MSHDVIWTEPPPLRPNPSVKYIPERNGSFDRPAILRFSTDSFMDDFLNAVATEPARLRSFKVRPETWRGFTPAPEIEPRKPSSLVLKRLGLFRSPGQNGSAVAVDEEPESSPAAADMPLKLYQPAHQRYYLVTSSLVCRVPGLPDREVDATQSERVGFVMRRLLPPSTAADAPAPPVEEWEEHAWVMNVRGSSWRKVANASVPQLGEGEEVLPMFGVNADEAGRSRRKLFAGTIPVGRREAYLGAPKGASSEQNGSSITNGSTAPAGTTSRTARKILLRKEVTEPWKSLVAAAERTGRVLDGDPRADGGTPSPSERAATLKIEREQLQVGSWLVLLDLARFLKTYVEPVWLAIVDPSRSESLGSAQGDLYDAIEATTVSGTFRTAIRYDAFNFFFGAELYPGEASVPSNLRQALARFGQSDGSLNEELASVIESQIDPYDRSKAADYRSASPGEPTWPDFLFPVADPESPLQAAVPPQINGGGNAGEDPLSEATESPTDPLSRIDGFAALVVRALSDPSTDDAPEPAVPIAAVAPANVLEGWFRIRCVYDRPACAPLHHAVVSESTEPFLLAGFFDPDAPARPIRIGLPIDTTPAGLRKFDRNTAFTISSVLCGQIKRAKGMTFGDLVLSVLPWPFHKDLPDDGGGACKSSSGLDLGMICTLSIPIITICALILLMIMVTLLDIIFRWIPYFIMCFPIPGLKSKS